MPFCFVHFVGFEIVLKILQNFLCDVTQGIEFVNILCTLKEFHIPYSYCSSVIIILKLL